LPLLKFQPSYQAD